MMEWLKDYYSPHAFTGKGLNPERPRWWILLRLAMAVAIVASVWRWAYPVLSHKLDGELLPLAGFVVAYLGASAVIRPRVDLDDYNPFLGDASERFVSTPVRVCIILLLFPGRIVVESIPETLLLIRYAFHESWKPVERI